MIYIASVLRSYDHYVFRKQKEIARCEGDRSTNQTQKRAQAHYLTTPQTLDNVTTYLPENEKLDLDVVLVEP